MTRAFRCTILLFFFLAACGEDKITVYSIPKEDSSQDQIAPQTPEREITWTAPAGWQEQPATEMRQGSFLVTGANGAKADISVTGFPGDAGGDLANVNRWRGQINLPSLDETALAGAAQNVTMDGEPALLVDFDEKPGDSGRKIVGAILHHEDKTWFFKMMGDASVVSVQKKPFVEFLNSVRFSGAKSGADSVGPFAAGLPMASPSAEAPGAPAQPMQAPVADAAKPQWTLPSGWQEEPAGGMRQGSFSITGGGSKVDISLVVLLGDAGGLLANVNRWRGQLSLPEVTDSDLPSLVTNVEAGGATASVVDMASEAPLPGSASRSRILGATIQHDGKTWFLKATGEDSLVEKHKAEFLDFLKSLRFPDHG